MTNYDNLKFYLDIFIGVILPVISFLVGITLNRLNKLGATIDEQTKSIFNKIDEIEKKIDERDERMRKEFNTRFQEERNLVYRLLDLRLSDSGGKDG